MDLIIKKDLSVSLPRKNDLENLMEIYGTNFERLSQFLPINSSWLTIKSARTQLYREIDQAHDLESYSLCIRLKDKIIGRVYIRSLFPKNRSTYMSYWVCKNYEGRGIMKNVIEHVCSEVSTFGIDFVELGIHPTNTPSMRLAQRLGFRKIPKRGYVPYFGELVDVPLYQKQISK